MQVPSPNNTTNKTTKKTLKALPIVIGLAIVALVVVGLLALGDRNSHSQTDAKAGTGSTADATTPADDSMHMDMPGTTDSKATATQAVTIDNYAFEPAAITVKVGQAVTWTNQDTVKHNVVADKASADAPNGPLIGRGETYSFTFNKAGTYSYHCDPHPYMKATVIVTQ